MARQPQSWSTPDKTPQTWAPITKDPITWSALATTTPQTWSGVDRSAEAWRLGASVAAPAPVLYDSPIYTYNSSFIAYNGILQGSTNVSDRLPNAWSEL